MLLLITRPRHDPPTHYLFYWAEILVKEAQKRNISVFDLSKEKANKKNFHGHLKKQPVDIVIINGHGDSSSVCGHDNEILLAVNDGTDLIKDKKIFIRACDSGSVLGPELLRKGAIGFIGYNQPFMFPRDKDSFHNPLKDELAAPVLECSNQVGLSLVKGKSVTEAQKDSLLKYSEKITEFSNSQSKQSYIVAFLHWNMSIQVCYSR